MSLVNESQYYDYYHQDKGIDQIQRWRVELRIEVCTIKFCLTHVKLILTRTEHTSTMSPVNEGQDYDY